MRGAYTERGAASPNAQYGPLQAGAGAYLDGSGAVAGDAEEAHGRATERAAICTAVADDADRGAEDRPSSILAISIELISELWMTTRQNVGFSTSD